MKTIQPKKLLLPISETKKRSTSLSDFRLYTDKVSVGNYRYAGAADSKGKGKGKGKFRGPERAGPARAGDDT